MAGNPKFLIGEKDGIEFGGAAEYIPDSTDVTFDDTNVQWSASTPQASFEAISGLLNQIEHDLDVEVPALVKTGSHHGLAETASYFKFVRNSFDRQGVADFSNRSQPQFAPPSRPHRQALPREGS